MSKESVGVFIPLADLQNYQPIITTELLVYSLIRGYERNAGFTVGESGVGVCIATADSLAKTLGITPRQVRDALHHLQYRSGMGARIVIYDDKKHRRKVWCSHVVLRELADRNLIEPTCRAKVAKILENRAT